MIPTCLIGLIDTYLIIFFLEKGGHGEGEFYLQSQIVGSVIKLNGCSAVII